jgi:hypothetical protein
MKTGTVLLGCKPAIGAVKKAKANDVEMIGRRWRDSYGNTYHTVTVYKGGKYVGDSPVKYGYERQFVQTGKDLLKSKGFRGKNYNIIETVTDVKRKKDL